MRTFLLRQGNRIRGVALKRVVSLSPYHQPCVSESPVRDREVARILRRVVSQPVKGRVDSLLGRRRNPGASCDVCDRRLAPRADKQEEECNHDEERAVPLYSPPSECVSLLSKV